MSRATKIPRFKSYEEEAEFWDTHSPEDFPEEFEEIEAEFSPPDRLDPEKRKRLIETLASLNDTERQMLVMSLLGLTTDEIAKVLDQSETDLRAALERIHKSKNQ